MLFIGILTLFIGILSIIGIILNCVSLNSNKNKFTQIILFLYVIFLGAVEINVAFQEKYELNLTDSDRQQLKNMMGTIQSNLEWIKTKILLLRAYSTLIIITSIIHIILNVYIIKLNNKSEIVNDREDIMNNSVTENNLIINNNLPD